MDKLYERVNWENRPSKKTKINAENLNKMDKALNDLDDRVIEQEKKIEEMVDNEQLSTAVDEALTKAKESGDFKGDKGDKGDKGEKGDKGDAGEKGSDASVTFESITQALGYTPADDTKIPTKLSQLLNDSGFVALTSTGTAGQFAVSDGAGGLTFKTIEQAEGVEW